jgi:hypothetical protein
MISSVGVTETTSTVAEAVLSLPDMEAVTVYTPGAVTTLVELVGVEPVEGPDQV